MDGSSLKILYHGPTGRPVVEPDPTAHDGPCMIYTAGPCVHRSAAPRAIPGDARQPLRHSQVSPIELKCLVERSHRLVDVFTANQAGDADL